MIGRLTGLAGVYLGPMIDTADEHAIVSGILIQLIGDTLRWWQFDSVLGQPVSLRHEHSPGGSQVRIKPRQSFLDELGGRDQVS